MEIVLSPRQRTQLEAVAAGERRVRHWRRYRAVLVLAEGQVPASTAASLGRSLSSVYGWATAWRRGGLAGLQGKPHGGGVVPLTDRADPLLSALLSSDPQMRGHPAANLPGGRRRLLAPSGIQKRAEDRARLGRVRIGDAKAGPN